jgi:hypothetical protein
MHQRGYKIIGLARTTGALYNKSGIDIEALWDYQRCGTFEGFPGAEIRTLECVFCDAQVQFIVEEKPEAPGLPSIKTMATHEDGQIDSHEGRTNKRLRALF